MKLWLVVFLVVGFLAQVNGALVQAAEKQGTPPRVTIETSEGSRLVGTISPAKLSLKASFATSQIDLNSIDQITFKENDQAQVRFRNGDTLTGKIDVKSLSLEMKFAKVKIPIDQVTSISVEVSDDLNLEGSDAEKTIGIRSANFGGETQRVLADFKAKCQNKRGICNYALNNAVVGDPLPNISKNITVEWTCGAKPDRHTFSYGMNGSNFPKPSNNADGTTVVLRCP